MMKTNEEIMELCRSFWRNPIGKARLKEARLHEYQIPYALEDLKDVPKQ